MIFKQMFLKNFNKIEFGEIDLVGFLLENKICGECNHSKNSYLTCSKVVINKKGITMPEHNTCEDWTKRS